MDKQEAERIKNELYELKMSKGIQALFVNYTIDAAVEIIENHTFRNPRETIKTALETYELMQEAGKEKGAEK